MKNEYRLPPTHFKIFADSPVKGGKKSELENYSTKNSELGIYNDDMSGKKVSKDLFRT